MEKNFTLEKKYNHKDVENNKYDRWVDKGLFNSTNKHKGGKKSYSLILPPPNVTGKLHLGHAWDTTLQDILIRFKRMQGYDVTWIPGMDHAGIATQTKVEQRLLESGIKRKELGREKFVDQIWSWKDEYSNIIREQWSSMGLSLDYEKEHFTLDEDINKAVKKVFVNLYNKKMIYKSRYIINWDPVAKTTISDIEVDKKEVETDFYYINYQIDNGDDHLTVATTRPETIFGDQALAVDPTDERYKKFIGKEFIVPITGKKIPVIADNYVDKDFGTGVVKITPAHDINDFEVGQRHNLEQVNVMNIDGTLNKLAGNLEGHDRFEARKEVTDLLKDRGKLVKVEKYSHAVGFSERTGAQIEPLLSTQWFLKMDKLSKQALKLQESSDKVNFFPTRFENTFTKWMEESHDWVISRQLWWGHQIPAWYRGDEIYVGEEKPKGEGWVQDEDVLDTWFSSALWPFTSLGWPDEGNINFKKYFPTSALVTGYDIIFFWVSRMIFQSLEFTGKKPFNDVIIHGLVRDENGKKMSKSLGNGIDPIEVIDEYGADALRWFLSTGTTPGQDLRFSYEKMSSSWNFINKIWNISRFITADKNDNYSYEDFYLNFNPKNIEDRWIISKLNQLIKNVLSNYEKYDFGEAGKLIYKFVWDEFADWYLEMSKTRENNENSNILYFVLDNILRLLHPSMPFVTDEIWSKLPGNSKKSITLSSFPEYNLEFIDSKSEQGINVVKDVVVAIRNIRSKYSSPLSKKISFSTSLVEGKYNIFKDNIPFIENITNTKFTDSYNEKDDSKFATEVIDGGKVQIFLGEIVDYEAEKENIKKELKKFESELNRSESKLSNNKFVEKAPEYLVKQEKDKVVQFKENIKILEDRMKEFND